MFRSRIHFKLVFYERCDVRFTPAGSAVVQALPLAGEAGVRLGREQGLWDDQGVGCWEVRAHGSTADVSTGRQTASSTCLRKGETRHQEPQVSKAEGNGDQHHQQINPQ